MTQLKKIARATVLALVLAGAFAGAVGTMVGPNVVLADSSGSNYDAG